MQSAVLISFLLALTFPAAYGRVTEVKAKPIYNDIGEEKDLLPDVIQLDLFLDGTTVHLNLSRQRTKPAMPSMTLVTQLNDQWSNLKNTDEVSDIYEDPAHQAHGSVAIRQVEGDSETSYTVTLRLGKKFYSLFPGDLPSSISKSLEKKQLFGSTINIDGCLHSVVESDYTVPEYEDISKIAPSRLMRRSTEVKKMNLTVEVLMAVDYPIFKKYMDISKEENDERKRIDATMKIKHFLWLIMDTAKRLFENTDFVYYNISPKWTGTFIIQNLEESILNKNGPRYPGALLRQLKTWYGENKDAYKLPKHDLFYLLTNDMEDGDGVSYMKQLCSNTPISIGLCNSVFSNAAAFSHELLHNLGVYHDDNTTCTANYKYVMFGKGADAQRIDNSLKLTNCRIAELKEHIDSLNAKKNNCMLDGEETDVTIGEIERYSFIKLYPGQLHDLDEQCRISHGPTYFYARGSFGDSDICKHIFCLTMDSKHRAGYKARALEGTSCNNGAWCQNMTCTPNPLAPRFPERCIYGDEQKPQMYNNESVSCKDLISKNPEACVGHQISGSCCASCVGFNVRNYKNQKSDCYDRTKECSTLEPRDCYNDYYARACCKTCQGLVKNPSQKDCLYGDKGNNCSELTPHVCKIGTQYCCDTCNKLDGLKKNQL